MINLKALGSMAKYLPDVMSVARHFMQDNNKATEQATHAAHETARLRTEVEERLANMEKSQSALRERIHDLESKISVLQVTVYVGGIALLLLVILAIAIGAS